MKYRERNFNGSAAIYSIETTLFKIETNIRMQNLLFINDFTERLKHSTVLMYADDTVLYVSNKKPAEIERCLNQDMKNVFSYFQENELIINMKKGKTKIMLFRISKRVKDAGEVRYFATSKPENKLYNKL